MKSLLTKGSPQVCRITSGAKGLLTYISAYLKRKFCINSVVIIDKQENWMRDMRHRKINKGRSTAAFVMFLSLH